MLDGARKEFLDAAETLMASTSPADNAVVGGVVASCPKVDLNLGFFFDGTFNNAQNVARLGEGADGAWTTNIFRLSQYYNTAAHDRRHPDCGTLKEASRGFYVSGIGTEVGAANDGYGGATGHGARGVAIKAENAMTWLARTVNEFGGLSAVRQLRVDIFGFSRGAATARLFANRLRNQDPKLQVRFLGLHDTVGSFGIPGNDREMGLGDELSSAFCELPMLLKGGMGMLHCATAPEPELLDINVYADTAQAVFHIVADDEFRSFFPVTSVKPGHGIEITVPGSHGDTAGAVPTVPIDEMHTDPPEWLVDRGYFHGAPRAVETRTFGLVRSLTYTRRVLPGLGSVMLGVMMARATAAGVPLLTPDIAVPTPLTPLYMAGCAGISLPRSERRLLAARYAHSSHENGVSGFTNWAARSGMRQVVPNRP